MTIVLNSTMTSMKHAFYTAKAEVPLDELNDTIEALREKTQNVL